MRTPYIAFENALKGFYIDALMPNLTGLTAWAAAGALPLLLPRVKQMLYQFGIADASGVDLDAVDAFITSAFAAQPALEVPLLNLTFTAEDGAAFLARLRPQPNGAATHGPNANNTNHGTAAA